jgi:hypothetical protein
MVFREFIEYTFQFIIDTVFHITKSNLYLDSSLNSISLYKLQMFHVPTLMFIFCHLGCLSKESVQVRGFL